MTSLLRHLFLSGLAAVLRKRDSVEKIKESGARIFVALTYSTKEKELALATSMNLHAAIRFAKARLGDGMVFTCVCSHPFLGADDLEKRLKLEMLKESRVKFAIGRPIINSITEMEAIRDLLIEHKIDYRKERICLVTCDFHSRAASLLAEVILGVKPLVFCNAYPFEVERDHPTPDQRTWVKWLPLSLARLAVCWGIRNGITSLDRWRDRRHKGKGE